MTLDATTLLIQRIESQLSSGGAGTQESNTNLLGQVDSVVAGAANYAQLLGLAAAAGGATEGVGAILVLAAAFFLSVLTASGSGSTETEQLDQLNNEVADIEDVVLATYWQDKLNNIMTFWNSPTGGLGSDLDNLANEGTGGVDVKNDVSHFHDNALAFVNNFIPSKTPGAEVFWERPVVQSQAFSPQLILYYPPLRSLSTEGSIKGWYGNLPQPQAGAPFGGSAMALDPRSMLPFLLLGIESYLTIEGLVHAIDANQPTFVEFSTQFKGDLQEYVEFIYSNYQTSVNGIVKSDMPSNDDVVSFVSFMFFLGTNYTNLDGDIIGSAPLPNLFPKDIGSPYTGYAWDGVYGVVDTYPPYGAYEPSPPVPVPYAAPSYIIDIMNTDNLVSEVSYDFSFDYLQDATIRDWILPWVQDKLILGRMARWKAVYLINGFDKVWSILQNLCIVASMPPYPIQFLEQDGTLANGNWSARELCTILNTDGGTLDGTLIGALGVVGSYSLFGLVQGLDNIARGNWSGPPGPSEGGSSHGSAPSRPLGFRDRLAAAAV